MQSRVDLRNTVYPLFFLAACTQISVVLFILVLKQCSSNPAPPYQSVLYMNKYAHTSHHITSHTYMVVIVIVFFFFFLIKIVVLPVLFLGLFYWVPLISCSRARYCKSIRSIISQVIHTYARCSFVRCTGYVRLTIRNVTLLGFHGTIIPMGSKFPIKAHFHFFYLGREDEKIMIWDYFIKLSITHLALIEMCQSLVNPLPSKPWLPLWLMQCNNHRYFSPLTNGTHESEEDDASLTNTFHQLDTPLTNACHWWEVLMLLPFPEEYHLWPMHCICQRCGSPLTNALHLSEVWLPSDQCNASDRLGW
jgi:hypothetical protein